MFDISNYYFYILKNVPRILSQIDRDENSPTYGSCDRNFWHYKIRDFSSAILQQTGLTLSILYTKYFPGNVYFGSMQIRKWAESTIDYWIKLQLKDGSFNEYYPNEHGFPPTAFSLFAVCETYKRLGINNEEYLNRFRKTVVYLLDHHESQAMNQEIASIAAVYSFFTITNETWIIPKLELKLSKVYSSQSSEGWFPEYGGADLGYLSVSLDMLSEYYIMSNDLRAQDALNRVITFTSFFVHPNNTIGGEYGSRNTTYFLPNGLEVVVNNGNPIACAIRNKLFSNVDHESFFMNSVDERYLTHYVLHSFLRAVEKNNPSNDIFDGDVLPCEKSQITFFRECGLVSFSNKDVFAIFGLSKGGVVKIYKDSHEIFVDCGYRVDFGKGKIATTNWLDPTFDYNIIGNSFSVQGHFNTIKLRVPTPFYHLGLRFVSSIFGNKIIEILKKQLIFNGKRSEISFLRNFELSENKVTITDKIKCDKEINLKSASTISLRHVASGNFFSSSDLIDTTYEYYPAKNQTILTDLPPKFVHLES